MNSKKFLHTLSNQPILGASADLEAALRQHRDRLVDTSRRNALINFPLRDHRRSRRFVRVVDELPDVLFERLLAANGKPLRFQYLENDDALIPVEEKSQTFRNALAKARRTDVDYLDALRMPAPSEDVDALLAKVERDLRNRVRVQLGMAPVDLERSLTPEQAAQATGINPSFDLPRPMPDFAHASHHDDKIQTLLFEDELGRKLNGLHAVVRSHYEEQGIASLYAMFGCLEWYDDAQATGQPRYAPLLLLPVEMKRRLEQGRYTFFLSGSDRDTVDINRCLDHMLARDFGLRLPTPPEDVSTLRPEAYWRDVDAWLARHRPNWRLRRFVQIGVASFARMVMQADLDSAIWTETLEHHPTFATLMRGSPPNQASFLDEDGQDAAAALPTPMLVTDADSSQFAVVARALAGENLAVEGPPGTGKSQTIVNLIAAALTEGKSVLFLAEKMAALDVVFARLEEAGLGDFCLKLHATGAHKGEIMDALERRLVLKRDRSHRTLAETRRAHAEKSAFLDRYAAVMGSTLGPDGDTVHDILFRSRHLSDRVAATAPAFTRFELANAERIPAQDRRAWVKTLAELAELRSRIEDARDEQGHPFDGVTRDARTPFAREDVIAAMTAARDAVAQLKAEASPLLETGALCLEGVQAAIANAQQLPAALDGLRRRVLRALLPENDFAVAQAFRDGLKALADNPATQPLATNEQRLLKDETLVHRTAERACAHLAEKATVVIMHATVKQLETSVRAADRFEDRLRAAMDVLGIAPPITVAGLEALVTTIEAMHSIPVDALAYLDDPLHGDDVLARVDALVEPARRLRAERAALQRELDLSVMTSSRLSLAELAQYAAHTSPLAATLSWEVRTTRATLAKAARQKLPRRGRDRRMLVERVKRFQEDVGHFEADLRSDGVPSRLREARRGIDTPSEPWLAAQAYRRAIEAAPCSEWAALVTRALAFDADMKMAVDGLAGDLCQTLRTIVAEQPPTRTISDLTADAERDRRRLSDLGSLLGALEDLGLSENVELARLGERVNERRHRLELAASLDAHPAGELLGTLFDGSATDRQTLEPLFELRGVLAATGLVSSDDDGAWILTDEYERRRAALLALAELEKRARAAVETLASTAGIEAKDFVGSPLTVAPFEHLIARLERCLDNTRALEDWGRYRAMREAMPAVLEDLVNSFMRDEFDLESAATVIESAQYRRLARLAYDRYPELTAADGGTLDSAREEFRRLDREILNLQRDEIRRKLLKKPIPQGRTSALVRDLTDLALVKQQIASKRRLSIRRLFERANDAILALMPCLLMSPMSVAQFLPRLPTSIDLLIIDEASQMRPEDALGAVLRSTQMVVVGDPKQLPPSSFFVGDGQTSLQDDDDEDEDTGDVEAILDRALMAFPPPRRLRYHYRSRHPSLIAFSNQQFYDSDLVLFPSPVGETGELGVTFTYVPEGRFRKSVNDAEAERVLKMFRAQIRNCPDESVGIVALNQPQAELIAGKLDHLRAQNEEVRTFLERFDDSLTPVFVKNLENVQGDERDAIIISIVYGKDPQTGKVYQRFGPINRRTGWRRLNVLVTRARHRIHVVSSMRATDVQVREMSSAGVVALRDYLDFAETGRLPQVRKAERRDPESPFEEEVMTVVRQFGYEVVPQVGVEGFFIDVGIVDPEQPGRYLLGIECDGASYHSSRDARERDRLRQQILENLGWSLHRIWSTDWFSDPVRERERLKATLAKRIAEERCKEQRPAPVWPPASSTAEMEREPAAPPEPPPSSTPVAVAEPSDESKVVMDDVSLAPARRAQVGDTIIVEKLYGDGERMRFVLTEAENDPDSGTVSVTRPLGDAVLDAEIGEEVEYTVGVYQRRVRVVAIETA